MYGKSDISIHWYNNDKKRKKEIQVKTLFLNLIEGFKDFWNAINDESFKKRIPQKREENQHSINDTTSLPVINQSKTNPIIGTINTFFKREQLKQNLKLITEQNTSLCIDNYFWALFWFLLEHSNEITGINFKKRLQAICDTDRIEVNEIRRQNNFPPLPLIHTNFGIRLSYLSIEFARKNENYYINIGHYIYSLVQKHLFIVLPQKRFDITIRYKLSGRERENLVPEEEIAYLFDESYNNSIVYNPNQVISCNSTTLDKQFLNFHLIQYGKWKEPCNENSDELSTSIQLGTSSTGIHILNDYMNNRKIFINLKDTSHFLVCGESNSGKTFFSTFLAAAICRSLENAELFIFDFKGDETLNRFKHHERYYGHKECEEGLENIYSLFSKRLDNISKDTHPIIIYFDELASYINSFSKRADKEAQQRIIAEILMMGRSKRFHLITSTQRPDSELFKLGSRINYSFRYLMGASCSNTDAQKMMFDNTDTEFKSCKQGNGFLSINGSSPILTSVPIIENLPNMYSILDKALTSN